MTELTTEQIDQIFKDHDLWKLKQEYLAEIIRQEKEKPKRRARKKKV